MASENNFKATVDSLFKGMDSFITAKTVVGEAITVGDTIILPLIDVTFGVGAGAFSKDKKNNGGGGMGGKISPSAVLVISNGTTKLVNIKNQDTVTKLLDMVPDLIERFTGEKKESKENEKEDSVESLVKDIVSSADKKEENESTKYSFDRAFIGSCGVDMTDCAITTLGVEDGLTKKAAVHSSRHKYVVMERDT